MDYASLINYFTVGLNSFTNIYILASAEDGNSRTLFNNFRDIIPGSQDALSRAVSVPGVGNTVISIIPIEEGSLETAPNSCFVVFGIENLRRNFSDVLAICSKVCRHLLFFDQIPSRICQISFHTLIQSNKIRREELPKLHYVAYKSTVLTVSQETISEWLSYKVN